jgi:hypothetical protein
MNAMRSRLSICLLLSLALSSSAAAQAPASCDTRDACRAQALEAAASGDFERFHDLAWLAVRKGKPNDPDLMLLLARAQSLSGRPGDALVMLRRLASMGVATDAETNDDFQRVRALSGWPEVAILIASVRENTAAPAAARAEPGAAVGTSSAPASTPSNSARPPAPRAAPAPDAREPLTIARGSFAPVGLAYDAVSRRFIAGDRRANKLMVLDEEFRRVNDLAAADSAGFFGLTAVEIDRARGDLWVANARADGSETALHRLQLISGRVLHVMPLPATYGAATFADVALTPAGTVLALDTRGKRVFTLRGNSYGRPLEIANAELVSIAALDEQTACVATRQGLLRVDLAAQAVAPVRAASKVNLAGFVHIRAHQGAIVGVQPHGDLARIVRVRLDGVRARAVAADVLAEVAIADPTSLSIQGGTLHYLGRDAEGTTSVRHLSLDGSR